jgi:hypothetical protein
MVETLGIAFGAELPRVHLRRTFLDLAISERTSFRYGSKGKDFKVQGNIVFCDTFMRQPPLMAGSVCSAEAQTCGSILAAEVNMKLRKPHSPDTSWSRTGYQHELLIGPLVETGRFSSKARLFYCRLCKWSLLVCRNEMAVLRESKDCRDNRANGKEFSPFDDEMCPILKTLASDYSAEWTVTLP